MKQVVKPRVKGFICINSHPQGCRENVLEQIKYAIDQGVKENSGPSNVLIIGASQGFGLASRIISSFQYKAKTLGIFFERAPQGKKTGSAGWYMTKSFEDEALKNGFYAKSINGDAFSKEVKNKAFELIKQDMGKIDLLIYSLAAPRRCDPETGITHQSVLKTVGQEYTSKNINMETGEITQATLKPASDEEIANTIKVMGGEDWELWTRELLEQGLFSEKALNLAYSYIGPKVTYPMYRSGTIGKAKEHLEKTALELNSLMQKVNGNAYTSVNKALVTQASSAIPYIPLYIIILYKVMKEKGLHEGCIEQIDRLFREKIYTGNDIPLDDKGRIRIDDWEMREDVQNECYNIWKDISTENVAETTDIKGYREDFLKLFGFGLDSVDYEIPVETEIMIQNLC